MWPTNSQMMRRGEVGRTVCNKASTLRGRGFVFQGADQLLWQPWSSSAVISRLTMTVDVQTLALDIFWYTDAGHSVSNLVGDVGNNG